MRLKFPALGGEFEHHGAPRRDSPLAPGMRGVSGVHRSSSSPCSFRVRKFAAQIFYETTLAGRA